MDNQQSGQRDEWPNITETITNYEDKVFLNSLWCPDKCDDWFSSVKKNETMNSFSRKDAVTLGDFIEERQLNGVLAESFDADWPVLLKPYLQYICDTISSMHKVEKRAILGSGGFGTVFRGSAYIYNTRKEIALKKSNIPDDPTFQREIEMLEKLKSSPHQFIVQFFGMFLIGKIEYIAMELCGGNLHAYVEEWKNTDRPDIDRMVLGQIVVALQHLRGLNIVHKDLNPNNVLFKRTKCDVVQVKLAEFGISKQKKYGKKHFSETENKGTPGYISPELQGTGKPSFESDIWALGAVVYFIASKGDHPYYIDDFNREIVNVLVRNLQSPPKASDLHDWSAADLVRSLMAFEPEKRPSIYLVLLHPYFSTANEKTRLHLAVAINDFYIANKGSKLRLIFKEHFKEPNVRSWYENLEVDWMRKPEDEEFLQSISETFAASKDSDERDDNNSVSMAKGEESIAVQDRIRKDISSELNHSNLIENVKPYITGIIKLLDTAPKLFAYFSWHVLNSLSIPEEDVEIFKDSALYYTIYHCSAEFYIEIAEQTKENGQRNVSFELRQASMLPDTKILIYVLNELKASVNAPDDENWTPLHHAARYNSNAEIVKLLIDAKVNVNAPNEKNWTPLHRAAER